jgi:hypothetical protein
MRPAKRWQLAGVVIALALVIATAATVTLARRGHTNARNGSSAPAAGSQRLRAEAAAQRKAVAWITSQVGRDVIVACDSVTCSALAQHGFPAGNLNVLQPTAPDPYGSVLVVATADIRSQFGSKLSAVYAPEVIASFGSGTDRIDVRVIAQLGPAAFRSAVSSDLAMRKSSGAQLLGNSRITVSGVARSDLASGRVDSRLLTTIAFVAHLHPVDIVGFGGVAPGADPGVPMRVAYLAESVPGANLSPAAYGQALAALVKAQQAPFVALSVGTVLLKGGQPVLQIEFAAPSPLGLPS